MDDPLAIPASAGDSESARRPLPTATPFDGPIGDLPVVPGRSTGRLTVDDVDDVAGQQASLAEAADRVQALAEAQPGDTGFAGIEFENVTEAVVVHWRGKPPDDVSSLIGELGSDIPISVAPADYSLAELTAEADRIMTEHGRAGAGGTVLSVGPNDDYSGLQVVVTSDAALANERGTVVSDIPLAVAASSGAAPSPCRRTSSSGSA